MAIDILVHLARACGFDDAGEIAFNPAGYADGWKLLSLWHNNACNWEHAMLVKEDGNYICGMTYEDIVRQMYAYFSAGQTLKVVKMVQDIYSHQLSVNGIEQVSELNAEMPCV